MIIDEIIPVNKTPQRIISLVPSITELLFDLGLEKEICGITKFCIHPEALIQDKEKIGGTKNLNIEKIKSLQPDLIIANKEENVKDQIETLSKEFQVLLTDVDDFDGAIKMIRDIGIITNKSSAAKKINETINLQFSTIETHQIKKAVYLIWKTPYMTIGGDTFINSMMNKAGLTNTFHQQNRYPEIELEMIANSDCEYILLSSEPYPFNLKHVSELQKLFPDKKVHIVDGEMFSWYGSRMIKSADYFNRLTDLLMPSL